MLILPIAGFLTIGTANYFASKGGYCSFKTGDKDILFPFSTMVFFFFSLLIYLPQVCIAFMKVHRKINLLSQSEHADGQLNVQQEDDDFPVAFLFSLLALSLAVFLDKFCMNKSQNLKNDQEKNLRNDGSTSSREINHIGNNKQDAASLKYFLSLSILFINLFNTYFVTHQQKDTYLLQQLMIILMFGVVLNFAFGKALLFIIGFLLAWSEIQEHLVSKLLAFVNFGLLVGYLLGLFMDVSSFLVILPCISVGFAIYTSAFICLPKIYTNGQKPVQDKFRYWAISTSLLLTLVYYPILYLLKI